MMGLKTVGTVTFHYGACKNCVHRSIEIGGSICNMKPELYYHANTVECADYLSIDESEE